MHAHNCFFHWPTVSLRMLAHVSMRCCFKSLVSRHFRFSYLKPNTVKVKGQAKLNMLIIFESVLIMFTQNYQNQSMFDETTARQSWLVFWDTMYSIDGRRCSLEGESCLAVLVSVDYLHNCQQHQQQQTVDNKHLGSLTSSNICRCSRRCSRRWTDGRVALSNGFLDRCDPVRVFSLHDGCPVEKPARMKCYKLLQQKWAVWVFLADWILHKCLHVFQHVCQQMNELNWIKLSRCVHSVSQKLRIFVYVRTSSNHEVLVGRW